MAESRTAPQGPFASSGLVAGARFGNYVPPSPAGPDRVNHKRLDGGVLQGRSPGLAGAPSRIEFANHEIFGSQSPNRRPGLSLRSLMRGYSKTPIGVLRRCRFRRSAYWLFHALPRVSSVTSGSRDLIEETRSCAYGSIQARRGRGRVARGSLARGQSTPWTS